MIYGEYARGIAEAKRDDTRARRAEHALLMLRLGTKTPDAPRPQ